MKEKSLRKYSITNLILGYVLGFMFIMLIFLNLNRDAEENIETEITKEVIHQTDNNITVNEDLHIAKGVRHNNNIYYKDHLDGVITQDRDLVVYEDSVRPSRTIRRGDTDIILDHDNPTYIRPEGIDESLVVNGHNYENINGNIGRGRLDGASGDGIRGIRNRHGIRTGETDRDDGADVDIGLLDRRLREMDLTKEDSKEDIGLADKDGINFGNLSIANKDEGELGELEDFNVDPKNGSKYGVGKGGELYAYNFPSQGVGAGVGSGGVGAAGSVAAGLGAGIGEGVAGGETVPTLGGVGTYTSVQTVPPGTGTDSDGDGLPAEAEAALGTDPNKADSDGDGYSDGAEVTSYTNPRNASSNPGVPGSGPTPGMGGVGGLVGGAGAGGAAGLVTGMVKKVLGVGIGPGKGCAEHGGNCDGSHGGHGHANYDHLPKDGALHIMMHVDGSGSILNTRKQLDIMKDTLLKKALLPYYNNDEGLYNRRVTIVDGNGERTLQFFTEATKKDNVLAIVFQDEGAPSYHLPTFNKKPQDHYSKDMNKLKSSLNGYGGVYRGVMFQVDRGKTFAKSFKEFVGNAFKGEGYLKSVNLKKYHKDNNNHHIRNKDGIIFNDEYHAKDSGDPEYYLNLIFDASKKIGLDLDIYGAGLTDGKKVNNNY